MGGVGIGGIGSPYRAVDRSSSSEVARVDRNGVHGRAEAVALPVPP